MQDYRALDQINNDTANQSITVLPVWLVKNSKMLKGLSHCQVMIGLVTTALSLLYLREGALSVFPVGIFVGFYYAICGFIGICGSASYRRGLVIAYFTMLLHSIFVFVPLIIIHSIIAFYFDSGACQVSCQMRILTCQFTCQSEPTWSLVSYRSAQSIDVGHIILSVIEITLALMCCLICCINTCESFKKVDRDVMIRIMDFTMKQPLTEPIEDVDLSRSK
uniref:Uncharacterized protein n=1 Tax=Romanomermis culicivorax TaxID=13658 RepID=A0A915K673_ROMCU